MRFFKKLAPVFAGVFALSAAPAITGQGGAYAAEYPSKPITMIVPTRAGGGVDTQARALAPVMEKVLGQPVKIVNRKGAGGTVGIQKMLVSKPDGYTIAGAASVSILQNPIIQKLKYGIKDMTVIATTGQFQTAIVAAGKAPFKSWDEFVKYAKANPGTKWYSLGKSTVAVMKAIAGKEGIKMDIVPGQGGATLAPALLAGDADVSISGGIHAKFLKSGELQVLISTLGSGKLMATPNVPSAMERYGVSLENNMVIVGPKGMSADVVKKLSAAVKAAAESDRYKKVMNTIQFPVTYLDSEASTKRYLQQEMRDKALLGR